MAASFTRDVGGRSLLDSPWDVGRQEEWKPTGITIALGTLDEAPQDNIEAAIRNGHATHEELLAGMEDALQHSRHPELAIAQFALEHADREF